MQTCIETIAVVVQRVFFGAEKGALSRPAFFFDHFLDLVKPMGDWINILAYRDFCDVPRMFLVVLEGRTYLFDCAFDDELDEYSADYAVYELHSFHIDALSLDWTELPHQEATLKGRVPVRDVLFDATRRRQIFTLEDWGLV
jgi:hypothetical protein